MCSVQESRCPFSVLSAGLSPMQSPLAGSDGDVHSEGGYDEDVRSQGYHDEDGDAGMHGAGLSPAAGGRSSRRRLDFGSVAAQTRGGVDTHSGIDTHGGVESFTQLPGSFTHLPGLGTTQTGHVRDMRGTGQAVATQAGRLDAAAAAAQVLGVEHSAQGVEGIAAAAIAVDRFTPAGERFSPAGKRSSPAGERSSPAGERFSPVGARFSPVGERASPSLAALSRPDAAFAGDPAMRSISRSVRTPSTPLQSIASGYPVVGYLVSDGFSMWVR